MTQTWKASRPKWYQSQGFRTLLFLFPTLVLLGTLFIIPIFMTVGYSMTNLTLTGSASKAFEFVGFRNFANMFQNPKFIIAMKNTFIFLFFSAILGQMVFGFLLASMMQHKPVGFRRFAGLSVIVGWVTPEVICAICFSAFFADKGTLNTIIRALGFKPVSWLVTFPMASVIIANIWKGCAYSMMMYQAALDNIPDELLEAARVDGASPLTQLVRIKIPLIKNTIATNLVLITLATLGVFSLIYTMTAGGPSNKTTTLSILMYQEAFINYQLGYGTAISMIILGIGIVLSLCYLKLLQGERKPRERRRVS